MLPVNKLSTAEMINKLFDFKKIYKELEVISIKKMPGDFVNWCVEEIMGVSFYWTPIDTENQMFVFPTLEGFIEVKV